MPHRQADLDSLSKAELLKRLRQDATREELLGLWLSIDWRENHRPGEDFIAQHDAETVAAIEGVQLATEPPVEV